MTKLTLTCGTQRDEHVRDLTFKLEANLPPELANEVVALVMHTLSSRMGTPVTAEESRRGVL